MKVLFVTCPRIGLNRGGLEVKIEKITRELDSLGVEVIYYDVWQNQIPNVDICHMFTVDGSILPHMQRASKLGKGVVISPIFSCFESTPFVVRIKAKLSLCVPGMYSDLVRAASMFNVADRVFPINKQEKNMLIKVFDLPTERFEIVPNGLNKRFCSGDPSLFENKYGVKDFVLHAGRIDPNKNQLTLIKAMRDLPYKLILIGPNDDKDYLRKCHSAAGENVIFTGSFNYEDPMLPSAFAAAKLFVLPSFSEVMPLTLYEAGVAGCKLLASKNFPVAEEISEYVPRFDPTDYKQLADLIDREMKTPVDKDLAEATQAMPSWEDVGRKIKGIYEEII